MIELARQYGRYGYRRVAALLRDAGWQVNHKRVERLWRREGLKVPVKQPKRDRLWLNDGSCVRLRAEQADHVWSYDFVHHRTHDGRAFRTLNILDEFTRESLAIRVRRKLSSTDVIDVLTDLFILRGIPAYVRSDNGPEFVAGAVRRWIAAVGARTAFIEPGSPWENGYIESFNARLRDELLSRVGPKRPVSLSPMGFSGPPSEPDVHLSLCIRLSKGLRKVRRHHPFEREPQDRLVAHEVLLNAALGPDPIAGMNPAGPAP